jgi:DNA-binding transcriptional ArsR family regulator
MRTPNRPESFLRHPTSTLLATPGSVRVLREILEAERPLAVSTLAERTGLTTQTVRNALGALRKGGIVEQLGEGRSRLFRPDVGHPLYLPLGSLFHAERERFETVVEGVATAVGNLVPAPLGAWIYGSVARREDPPDADVEVALVSTDEDVDTPVDRLREMLSPIQEVQRVWFSVVGLSPGDVRRLASGDRWWKRATRPHLTVFGRGPDDLAEELARPRGRDRTFRR